MQIFRKKEATNPGNIGGYKNTPYTGECPIWTAERDTEPGSHKKWHDKDYIKEGFIDTLFDMATVKDDAEYRDIGKRSFEQLIKPHTADELYDSVCYCLANKSKSKLIKEAAELFVPYRRTGRAPTGTDTKVFEDIRHQIEDAIIEYCTVDAIDIIQRLSEKYKEDASKITPEVRYGTILRLSTTDEYDLCEKIKKQYNKWRKYLSKLPEEPDDKKSAPEPTRGDGEKELNKVLKKLCNDFRCTEEELYKNLSAYLDSDLGRGQLKLLFNNSGGGK